MPQPTMHFKHWTYFIVFSDQGKTHQNVHLEPYIFYEFSIHTTLKSGFMNFNQCHNTPLKSLHIFKWQAWTKDFANHLARPSGRFCKTWSNSAVEGGACKAKQGKRSGSTHHNLRFFGVLEFTSRLVLKVYDGPITVGHLYWKKWTYICCEMVEFPATLFWGTTPKKNIKHIKMFEQANLGVMSHLWTAAYPETSLASCYTSDAFVAITQTWWTSPQKVQKNLHMFIKTYHRISFPLAQHTSTYQLLSFSNKKVTANFPKPKAKTLGFSNKQKMATHGTFSCTCGFLPPPRSLLLATLDTPKSSKLLKKIHQNPFIGWEGVYIYINILYICI